MKTRRKTVKTPTKGRRRSSVIVVKKSPIKRNTRRNAKIANKRSTITDYESPLLSLKDNEKCSVKAKCNIKEEQVEETTQDVKPTCSLTTTKCNVTPSETITQEKIVNNYSNEQNNSICNGISENNSKVIPNKSKKRNASTLLTQNKPNLKKQKLKKSPLSKIRSNESSELNEISKSIIILDDSLSEPLEKLHKIEKKYEVIKNSFNTGLGENSNHKPVLIANPEKIKNAKSVSNTIMPNQTKNCESVINIISDHLEPFEFVSSENELNSETATNNEEIVEIDCNDTLMEMEAYHNAFNQNTNLQRFAESVIVIDPDDDEDNVTSNDTNKISAKRTNDVSKPVEDCFVVWSSLPKPCTSTSTTSSTTAFEKPTFSANPLHNNNLDILKFDKILIDTNADFNNLRMLNNENNKPNKNQFKSPKKLKGTRKQSLKTKVDKGKALFKNSTKAKTAIKTTAKTIVKKKGKSSGELIFSSESKEGGENKAAKKILKGKLREIVIDGSNAAMAYTHSKVFSEKGIQLLIDYFIKRGHTVKVFIPQSRRSRNFPMLEKWFNDGIVVFTPSRKIGNKFITSYDDRYILEYASTCGGIVVSQDQFRDLYQEKPQYRDTIENRLLVPTFVGDYVMFPEDPLGRDGPILADFLKH